MAREEADYELAFHVDEGSCNEEEEYHLIYDGDKESEDSTEALVWEHSYSTPTTLRTSPKVRYRDLSPSAFANTGNTNVVNSRQGSQTSQKKI